MAHLRLSGPLRGASARRGQACITQLGCITRLEMRLSRDYRCHDRLGLMHARQSQLKQGAASTAPRAPFRREDTCVPVSTAGTRGTERLQTQASEPWPGCWPACLFGPGQAMGMAPGPGHSGLAGPLRRVTDDGVGSGKWNQGFLGLCRLQLSAPSTEERGQWTIPEVSHKILDESYSGSQTRLLAMPRAGSAP